MGFSGAVTDTLVGATCRRILDRRNKQGEQPSRQTERLFSDVVPSSAFTEQQVVLNHACNFEQADTLPHGDCRASNEPLDEGTRTIAGASHVYSPGIGGGQREIHDIFLDMTIPLFLHPSLHSICLS